MLTFFFFILAALSIWTSLMMITRRNPVHSALFLVLTFCSLAVLYFLLAAPFLGVLQVIVYAGAIMVLFLFVVMLLAAENREQTEADPQPGVKTAGYLVSIVFAATMIWVVAKSPLTGESGGLTVNQMVADNTQRIGMELFSAYLLPFEIISILLLAAMVGAIVLAQRHFGATDTEETAPPLGLDDAPPPLDDELLRSGDRR